MSVEAPNLTDALAGFAKASREAPGEPYRGLEPFRFADAGILAAREAEIERLVRLVTMYRGVLLYGESGAGKSSVVNAGLLPRLVDEGFWPHRVRVQPRAAEEFVLEPIRSSAVEGAAFLPSAFADAAPDGRLVVAADSFPGAATVAAERDRILLVFDQFEELVTLFGESDKGAAAQSRVVDAVVRLLRSRDVRVKILFAFREDYLASLEPLLAEQPELADQSLRLMPPPIASAEQIIRAPFDRFGSAFGRVLSPELAERIAALLGERSRGGTLNLSELQIVCRRLWEADDPEALLEARGVAGLLEEFLDEGLRAFEGASGDLAVVLLTRLVTTSGTRNVVSREDLIADAVEETGCEREVAEETLRRLETEAHLVRGERRRDIPTYEIVSEFLVPMIAALKVERQAAAQAERALKEAAKRHEEELAARRRMLFRIGAMAAAGVLVLVAALAVYAWIQRGDALAASDAAAAHELSAYADGVADRDPPLAAALALGALRRSWTPEAENTLRSAVSRPAPVVDVAAPGSSLEGSCCIAFSPDGRFVAGSRGKVTRVWDASSGKPVLTVQEAAFDGTAPSFTPDSRAIVVNGPKHVLREYSLDGRRVVQNRAPQMPFRTFGSCHVKTAYLANFSPDGSMIASPGADGFVCLWDRKGVSLGIINTHNRKLPLVDAQFTADSRSLITVRYDGLTEAWKMTEPRGRLFWSAEGVQRVSIAPEGDLVALVMMSGRVQLRNVHTGKVLDRLGGPAFSVDLAVFDPRGHLLAMRGKRAGAKGAQSIHVWDVQGKRRVGTISPGVELNDLAMSADGKVLATAEADGTVLWDIESGGKRARLGASGSASWNVALSADGSRLVTAGADGHVRVWSVPDLLPLTVLAHRPDMVWTTAFSPDGNRVATGGFDGEVTVHAVPAGELLSSFRGVFGTKAKAVVMVAFSPNAKLLATVNEIGDVALWDARHGHLVDRLSSGGTGVSVAFSPDGTQLAAAVSRKVIVWQNGASGNALAFRKFRTLRLKSEVEDAVFSRDGRSLAVSSDDGKVRIWDLARGTFTRVFDARGGKAYAVGYSGDGRHLAAGTEYGAVVVWDVASGAQVARLLGHADYVGMVLFTRDGSHVLSSSGDGTVRVWDWRARLGAVVATEVGGGASLDLSPNGRYLSVGGKDNTALLLDCSGCRPVETLKSLAGRVSRPLTPVERQKYLHVVQHKKQRASSY